MEEDLSRLWYGGGFARRGLRTRCGRRVRVLYRGLPNGDRGPDYLGAVLSLGRGQPRAGDIELHLRTSQWWAHGHHRDAHYERVILHVVWQDDDPHPTLLPSGRQVPVLALGGLSAAEDGTGFPGEPCRQARDRGFAWLGEALDRLGEDRFLGKAARLEGGMATLPPQEVLYQALAEALGYARNKEPFRRLAAALPLSILEGFLWGKSPARQEALAQALLLGAAGLLPSQRGLEAGGEGTAHLEELWGAYALEPPLGPGDWALGVRPENHPARRLAGLASLVVGSLEEGLAPWALGSLMGGFRVQGPGARLLNPEPWTLNPGASGRRGGVGWWCLLVRKAQGYWRHHFDFGRPGPLSPSLIGRGRALEMAVNAVLPFAYAYGQALGDEKLSQAALGAYALLPSPGSNQITRHMGRQILGAYHARLAGSARRQQGLLHLFRAYCTQGRCGTCPLASQ